MRQILVPYHHAESLPKLGGAFVADDAAVVSPGPPGAMIARLYDQVAARVAASGVPPIVASGDCTTALATVAGLQRRGIDPGVIWIDAHADFHTPHTTRSGYLGGMALAMIVGRCGASLARSIDFAAVAESVCVLVGARDIEPGEREALEGSRVARIDLDELETAPLPPRPWYVHFDVDVIDPQYVARLRFPAPGGPDPAAVGRALQVLARRGTIAAVGLACTFVPRAFEDGDPLESILPLITDAFEPSSTAGRQAAAG